MEDEKFIAVIYFGHTNITGVLAKKSGDNFTIIGTEKEESKKNVQHGILKGDVAYEIKSIVTKLNNVLQQKPGCKDFKIKSTYACINDYTLYMTQFSESQGIYGNRGFIKKDNYNKLLKAFDDTKIVSLEDIFISQYAVASCVPDEAKKNGCLIVDFEADTTSITLYNKGGIIEDISTFPLGGNNITLDIQNIYNLKYEDAETLKKEKSTTDTNNVPQLTDIICKNKDGENITISTKELAEVVEARMQEIWYNFVWKNVTECQMQDKLEGGIYFTGNASKLNGLRNFIERKSKFPVMEIEFDGFETATIKGIITQGEKNCIEKVIEEETTPKPKEKEKEKKNAGENDSSSIFKTLLGKGKIKPLSLFEDLQFEEDQ